MEHDGFIKAVSSHTARALNTSHLHTPTLRRAHLLIGIVLAARRRGTQDAMTLGVVSETA